MKKFRLGLLFVLSLMLIVFPLTACGGGDEPPVQYTVSFGVNNASYGSITCTANGLALNSGDKVDENTEITFTATENTGYTFDGYFSGTENKCTEKEYTVTITSDIDITAKFSVQSYALNFSATTGGTVDCEDFASGDTVAYNTTVILNATANTGYDFWGYYVKGELVEDENVYTFQMPASAIAVEAKFVAQQYDLTYFVNNTTMGDISCDIESGDKVAFNSSFSITAIEYTGYDFVGWYVDNTPISNSATLVYDVDSVGDIELEAVFIPEQHFFKYQVNDATMGSITSNTTNETNVDYGTQISLTATANSGYKFVGWFINGLIQEESVNFIYTMTENSVVIEARFDLDEFALTYSANNWVMGDIACDIESGERVEYLSSITLTAIENTGYDFVEWLVGGESKGSNPTYTFQMPASAVEIQAVFVPEKRTVTFFDGRDELKEQEVDFGTKINFEPTKLNYNFEGWYLESTLTTKFNVNNAITENLKLYAKWTAVPQSERQYEVNFVDHEGNPLNGWGTQLVQSGKYIKQIPNVPERVGYKFNNVWMRYDTAQGKYVNINNINTFQITQDVTITPKYDIITYTVKLYINDVPYTSKTVEYGSKLAKPQTPPNSDATKVFDKWVYKDDTSMTFDFENTVITSDLELKVAWKTVYTETFTVKFYNGSATLDTQKIEKGSKATEPTPPEVANQTFAGWYLETTFENEFDFATSITSNLDVYAKYVPKTYTVKFVDHDGKVIESQTISHGQSATFPEQNPTRENYTFSGWSVSDLSNITSDLEVKAQYQINVFSVNFIGFGETEIDEQTIEYDGFATIPQVPEIEGYSFEGWYLDQEYEMKFIFSTHITSNLTVYAKYVQNVTEKYKVIFLDALGEILSEQSVLHGNSAIVPASPSKVGNDFAGWIVEFADDGNDYTNAVKDYTNVQAPLIVTPDFTKKAYTVRFFDKDGNQLGANVSVLYEELVKVEDIPYNLIPEIPDMIASWDKDVETFIITKDTDFTVKYTYEPCMVTFIIDGEEPFTQVVDKGFYANIPNTPIKNYSIFDGWYLSGSDTEFNFSTETITEDITLYARFKRTSYVISFIGYDGNPYKNVQIVKAGGKAIEPAPYEDETLNDYVWCLENETEEFDFINSTINEDIVLYAKLVNNSN